MIYDVSHRTDIPAFYWDWFANRLDEGFVMVRNPNYPAKVSRYDLTPEVCDGFRFISKNYRPMLEHDRWDVQRVIDTYPCMFAYTITPYLKDLELHVPSLRDTIDACKELSGIVGKERLSWMYSPVVFMDGRYDLKYHKDAFSRLAYELAPYVSRCSIDMLRIYEKVHRNAPALRAPMFFEEEALVKHMVEVSRANDLLLHSCPGTTQFGKYGVDQSLCFTLEAFGEANGIEMKKLRFREGSGLFQCACATARDVGKYNTCPHGCAYCYANADTNVVASRLRGYDVESPLLLDKLDPADEVSETKPRIYRKRPKKESIIEKAVS